MRAANIRSAQMLAAALVSGKVVISRLPVLGHFPEEIDWIHLTVTFRAFSRWIERRALPDELQFVFS
jgi:hypothetical protein